MALSNRTATSQSSGYSASNTVSHTPTGTPSVAYVIVTYTEGGVCSSAPTYAGATMTLVGQDPGSTTNNHLSVWRKTSPASGTQDCVVAANSGSYSHATVVTYTGSDTTTPESGLVESAATGTHADNISSATGDEVLFGYALQFGGGTPSGSVVTLDDTYNFGGAVTQHLAGYVPGAATCTINISAGGDEAALVAFNVKAAASGTIFYLTNSTASSSNFGTIQVSGSAPSASTTSTGWTVDTVGSSNYALMAWNTERASSAFGGTALPSTSPNNTTGDCFRSATAMTGDFATGTWAITIPVIAVTAASGQDGRVRVRLWKSSNADGSSATEITSGAVTGTTVTDLTTGAEQTSVATTSSITGFSLANEYLFLQVAWEITGAAT